MRFAVPGIDPEDLDQEAAIAAWLAEASGEDPAAASRDATRRFLDRERRRSAAERPASDLAWAEEARDAARYADDRARTPGQLRRAFRDQMIYVAAISGMPQRKIALAAGLPRSRVWAIVHEMRARIGIDPYRKASGARP